MVARTKRLRQWPSGVSFPELFQTYAERLPHSLNRPSPRMDASACVPDDNPDAVLNAVISLAHQAASTHAVNNEHAPNDLPSESISVAPTSHHQQLPLTLDDFLTYVQADFGYASSGPIRRCDSSRTLQLVKEDTKFLFKQAHSYGAADLEPFRWFAANSSIASLSKRFREQGLKPAR